MLQSSMTIKGQVTIPKEIRDYLGIIAGDVVTFEPFTGGLVAAEKSRELKLKDSGSHENIIELPPTDFFNEKLVLVRVVGRSKNTDFKVEERLIDKTLFLSTPDVKLTCFLPYPAEPIADRINYDKGKLFGSMNIELRRLMKDDYIPDITFDHDAIIKYLKEFVVSESDNGYIVQLSSVRLRITQDEMKQLLFINDRLRAKFIEATNEAQKGMPVGTMKALKELL